MEEVPQRDATVAVHDLDGIDPHVYANRWKSLVVLCASLLIVIIGNTVLNVALPTLQRAKEEGGLGASLTQVQWMVDAYGLVFAGLLYTSAALGDRFGRKGALQGGLLLFASGSLIGALAPSSSVLIAARALMGVGAAFIMPSTPQIMCASGKYTTNIHKATKSSTAEYLMRSAMAPTIRAGVMMANMS